MSELDLYIKNQSKLLGKHNGKIIALQHGVVLGEYQSKTEALRDMKSQRKEPGSFLIIKCTPGDAEYTRKIRSSVNLGSVSRIPKFR